MTGLRTRATAEALPSALAGPELGYLESRDAYLHAVQARVELDEARMRAFRRGDEDGLREATRLLGDLPVASDDERARVRDAGRHVHGIAFRLAMRRLLDAGVVGAVEAESESLAGAEAVLIRAAAWGTMDGALAYPSLAAYRDGAAAGLADLALRPEFDPIGTPEVVVVAVASRLLSAEAFAAVLTVAEELLGRPAAEIGPGKRRSTPGEGMPVGIRQPAGVGRDDVGRRTRHRGARRPVTD